MVYVSCSGVSIADVDVARAKQKKQVKHKKIVERMHMLIDAVAGAVFCLMLLTDALVVARRSLFLLCRMWRCHLSPERKLDDVGAVGVPPWRLPMIASPSMLVNEVLSLNDSGIGVLLSPR